MPSASSAEHDRLLEAGADIYRDGSLQDALAVAGYQPWVYDKLHAERDQLLAVDQHMEGIDTRRLQAFCADVGIQYRAPIFLDEAEAAGLGKVGRLVIDKTGGQYDDLYDLAFVVRHPRLEAWNGPEFSEALAAHEIFHGWPGVTQTLGHAPAGWMQAIAQGTKHDVPIPHIRPLPSFLEEGLAEWGYGQYVKNVLNRPEGFGNGWPLVMPHDDRVLKYSVQLPNPNHGKLEPNVMHASYTYAALMTEELFKREPRLQEALLATRTDATQELRDRIRTLMEGVAPGFYDWASGFAPAADDEKGSNAAEAWDTFFQPMQPSANDNTQVS